MIKVALCLAARDKRNPGWTRCVHSFINMSSVGCKFGLITNTDPSNGAAEPVNKAIMQAYADYLDAELFVVGADDVECITPGWDTLLLERKRQLPGARVFMMDEGRKSGELLCHPVFTREWIDCLGYAVPSGYQHFYSDTDVERVARLAHILHYVPEVKIMHHIGSADADWRDVKLSKMSSDRAVYLSRKIQQENAARKLQALDAVENNHKRCRVKQEDALACQPA